MACPQHSPNPIDGITIDWEAEELGLELRLILNVGTYSELPGAPVSHPKLEACENKTPPMLKVNNKRKKYFNEFKSNSPFLTNLFNVRR